MCSIIKRVIVDLKCDDRFLVLLRWDSRSLLVTLSIVVRCAFVCVLMVMYVICWLTYWCQWDCFLVVMMMCYVCFHWLLLIDDAVHLSFVCNYIFDCRFAWYNLVSCYSILRSDNETCSILLCWRTDIDALCVCCLS